ncbi:MAG: RNA repair transcriptional activator RtcR family protein [Deltaproteobacteria bacterium]|nr:RNA repair transcriptional activator RtcR family protein [Deltaproteobacteria bacterium]
MIRQEELASALLAVELGNSVFALKTILSSSLPEELKKRTLREILKKVSTSQLKEKEREIIETLITENQRYFKPVRKILKELKRSEKKEYVEGEKIGRCISLLVVETRSGSFGCIHPVISTAVHDGKGERRILVNELTREVSLSFYAACEAIRYFLGKKGLLAPGQKRLADYGITVEMGKFEFIYDGGSIGLPFAVSIFSSLSNIPVPKEFAFTGKISIDGSIEGVKGLNNKLEIAYTKDIKKVYIPAHNYPEVDVKFSDLVVPVRSLGEVLESVFDKKAIDELVTYLNNKTDPLTDETSLYTEKGKSVLISTIGRRDPYGTSYDPDALPEFTEGPVLTAFRALEPNLVILLPTRDTLINAQKTKEEIERFTSKDICTIRKLDIDDPTDYDKVYIAILAALESVRHSFEDQKVFISVSSGTPQMHVVFIDLVRTGRVKAKLIQVKEPRFAKSWQDRVKVIKSEFLHLS